MLKRDTSKRAWLGLTGVTLGAGFMYFLDPDRGHRRRALVRDKVSRATNVGLGFVSRALSKELKRLTGISAGRRAIDVTKTIHVVAPVDRVFHFWANYENFPHVMSRLQDVRKTGEGRSHWRIEGPAERR
jgi:uncharacterized membrane protein